MVRVPLALVVLLRRRIVSSTVLIWRSRGLIIRVFFHVELALSWQSHIDLVLLFYSFIMAAVHDIHRVYGFTNALVQTGQGSGVRRHKDTLCDFNLEALVVLLLLNEWTEGLVRLI